MNTASGKKIYLIILILAGLGFLSFRNSGDRQSYHSLYLQRIESLKSTQQSLLAMIQSADMSSGEGRAALRSAIAEARLSLKAADFWLRYLEPVAYKKINGPLPVEWETEVFEKFEKPYKREGAGLTLAFLHLEEDEPSRDELSRLVNEAYMASNTYTADSITRETGTFHHFFLCNRLYLLNLSAIYTTGFECPDTSAVIPELKTMIQDVQQIYYAFNESFPETPLKEEYAALYGNMLAFVRAQPAFYSSFDHFTFIRDYVNPLFSINQRMILEYRVKSRNMLDYSLNRNSMSIFSKSLYAGQNHKGVFTRVTDEGELAEIGRLGKMLFYDPILSGNNQRSCSSCHKPEEYFTDTVIRTAPQFDRSGFLPRNTPTLLNAVHNHLLMADGKHITLLHQARGVVTSDMEMASDEVECLKKVMSCKEYRRAFKKLLVHTPQEKEVTFEHLMSALVVYYSKFSWLESPFDDAMNKKRDIEPAARQGFNLFMSKAQCATCHFVPEFNGVKPPYIGSEFEVLGVPADTAFTRISPDMGRYDVNPASETLHAFRTGTIRNTTYTAPYMHNGVFRTMEQVIDFYNAGGGAGRGLQVANQTLSSDSLGLNPAEKMRLIRFIRTLDEKVGFEEAPAHLPKSSIKELNRRKTGGEY